MVNQPNQTQRVKQLQGEYNRQEALHRLSQQEEYRQYLKPLLEQALYNKWLDPSEFNDNESFKKAYDEMFGRMRAFKELHELIEGAKDRAATIKKEMEKPEVNFSI